MISSLFCSPFGIRGFEGLLATGQIDSGGFTSFSSLSNFSGPSGGGAVKRTSTSTRFIGGKKIMTKK
jgi:hypothetical protein